MTERELHSQKLQAQLDEWKADLALFKARASGAGADAQLALRKQCEELDKRVHEAGVKLSDLAGAGEDAWESVRKGIDSAWDSLGSAVSHAKASAATAIAPASTSADSHNGAGKP